MGSSLFGIYNASRSMMVNQAALSVVNNNIANMNTEGYTKQRLEVSQVVMANNDTNNMFALAQSGSGALIDQISRNRDAYLDAYYQSENSKMSKYDELNENVTFVGDVMNELNENGMGSVLSEFYTAVSALEGNTTDSVARANFVQKSVDVATKFNQISEELSSFKNSLIGDKDNPQSLDSSKLNLDLIEFNQSLSKLADLNKNISFSTIQGETPNGLLDERDKILDQLSEFTQINVTKGANNTVSVSVGDTTLVNGSELLGSVKADYNTLPSPEPTTGTFDPVSIKFVDNADKDHDITQSITSGKLSGILDFVRTDYSNPDNLSVANISKKLDSLAQGFTEIVNNVQNNGQYITVAADGTKSLTPVTAGSAAENIFINSTTSTGSGITASNIAVNAEIIKDSFKVALAAKTDKNGDAISSDSTGNGDNVLAFSNTRSDKTSAAVNNTTVESYMNAIVGKLGIQSKSISDTVSTQTAVMDQLENRRESTSGVNLDEELADLMKYQRSYEASAKVFNTVNGILQTIIGLAG